jgi:hypothetical protein
MGMFDYLRCASLRVPEELRGLEYQTKSLDCNMDYCYITEEGYLERCKAGYDELSIGWHLMADAQCSLVDFSGDVYFYTRHDDSRWIEFKAIFKRGKMLYIEQLGIDYP